MVRQRSNELWSDKGARLKSERDLVGLNVLYKNITSANLKKLWYIVSRIISREYFERLTEVGEFVQRVHV